jgi:uncharacterized protein (DUF4415 family)
MTAESPAKIVSAVLADGKTMIRQADGTFRKAGSKTNCARVAALRDAEVEAAAKADTEAPQPDEDFWRTARVVMPEPRPAKRHQGLRLDAEIIDWLKEQGPGWQTRMNAVLKSHVKAQRRHGSR